MRQPLIGITILTLLSTGVRGADFPSYRGDGSGATDSGLTLIDDASQAKLLWSSEEPCPPSGKDPNAKPGGPSGVIGLGGYGVPVIVDGRIYFSFHIPTGPKIGYPGYPNRKSQYHHQMMADDVVICLDAKTGKTLWRTVFKNTAWNFHAAYSNYATDGQNTPCVAHGRVVQLNNTGRAFCLDAATGEKLWEKHSGREAHIWDLYRQDVVAGKAVIIGKGGIGGMVKKYGALVPTPPKDPELKGSGGAGYNSTPQVFADPAKGRKLAVFILMRSATVAFDLETGAERWRRGAIYTSASRSVIKWIHQGKEYLVGDRAVIDPATGKDIYQLPVTLGGAYAQGTWALSGDYIVAETPNPLDKKGAEVPKKVVTCLMLSADGAAEIWTSPFCFGANCPVIHRKHAYLYIRFNKGWNPSWPVPDGFDQQFRGGALACVELATGKVIGLGVGRRTPVMGNCPLGMDGRLFVNNRSLFDCVPDSKGELKHLGALPPSLECSALTGADGFLYLRPKDQGCLLQCWDFRKP